MKAQLKRAAGAAAATVAVAGALVGVAPVASAQDLSSAQAVEQSAVAGSPQLQKYLDGLSPADRQEFVKTNLPATVETQQAAPQAAGQSDAPALAPDAAAAPATKCWTRRVTWAAKALAGNTLYTFYQVGYWCHKGNRVTAARVQDAGGETKTPGWRYKGVIGRGSGVVANQGRSFSKHQFILGAGGVDIQHPQHCGRVRGYASKNSASDQVCGIY